MLLARVPFKDASADYLQLNKDLLVDKLISQVRDFELDAITDALDVLKESRT